jgi:hypothetical protein
MTTPQQRTRNPRATLGIIGITTLAFLSACGSTPNQEPADNASSTLAPSVNVTNDEATLEARIDRPNTGVTVQAQNPLAARALASDPLSFDLIAEVKPPKTKSGTPVRATHVSIEGQYALVSYNREGPQFAGAVDVFNISDPLKPRLVSSAVFDDFDVNAITGDASGQRIFLTGARKPSAENGLEYPAVLVELAQVSGKLQPKVRQAGLGGYSGNDIVRLGPAVFTSSGNSDCVGTAAKVGGTSVTVAGTISPITLGNHCQSQAIAVSAGSSTASPYLVALQGGEQGKLFTYKLQISKATDAVYLETIKREINVGAVTPKDSRNSLTIQGNLAFAALGLGGVKAFDLESNSSNAKYTMALENPTADPEVIANSVSVDRGLVYIAYGAGGLRVAKLPTATTDTGSAGSSTTTESVPLLAKLEVDGSANFVAVKDDLAFVASGAGGLKIVRRH